jgi:hypothetical protein
LFFSSEQKRQLKAQAKAQRRIAAQQQRLDENNDQELNPNVSLDFLSA